MAKVVTTLRRLAAGVAVASVAMAFGSVAHAESRPDLVIAVNTLARGMEPGVRSGNVDVRVNYSVFDTLIRRDFLLQAETGETRLIPGLAESWERIEPNVIELKLRKDVKWHDGTPFTAEDVLFSFGPERVYSKDAPVKRAKQFVGDIEKIEAPDPHTVRITYKFADPIIEHRLASYTAWIVQKANYMRFKTDEPTEVWMKKAVKEVTWNPVGTGPYKLIEYKAGEHIKLGAHDDYHLGKPAAKTVTFQEVPEVSARIAGLVSGEFDMIVEIPPDQIKVVDGYDDIDTKSVVLENSHVLVFNQKHPVLKDTKLRQAMTLGIDRAKLREALWDGKNITPNGNQMKVYGEYYIADFPEFEFDPEKAKQLLAESNYKGEEIEYRIIPAYYTNSMSAAQVLQEMWSDIGVNVKITPVENWKAVRAEGAAIYPWSNTVRYPDPVGQIVMSYGPQSAIQRRYKFFEASEEFNKATETLVTSTDKAERLEAARTAMTLYREEAPGTILYNPLSTFGVRKGIEYTPYTLYYMDLRPDNLKVTPQN